MKNARANRTNGRVVGKRALSSAVAKLYREAVHSRNAELVEDLGAVLKYTLANTGTADVARGET